MDSNLLRTQRSSSVAEVRTYVNILVKHWIFMVSVAVAGFLAVLVISLQVAPKYEASSTLYISVRADHSVATGDLLQGSNFAQSSMTSYVDLATTSLVLDQVAEELGQSPADLPRMLEVEAPEGSVLLKFTATSTSPDLAATAADTAGEVFIDVLQNEIEVAADGRNSPVQVQVVDSAVVPTEPVGPNVAGTSLLGLLAGLLLGGAVVVLREVLDTRFHSAREVEEYCAYPVLGRIGFDDQIKQYPLVIHGEYHNPRAEAFRTLRTNLQFLHGRENPVTLVVTSATSAEGKTHVVSNLAIVLAASGARVVLIEADLRRPRLSDAMGIEGAAGLTDVLIDRAELADLIQPWGVHDLMILPAGQIPPNPSELLGSTRMQKIIKELQGQADYVLIDAPPLLPVTDAAVISKVATGTLLVTALEQTKRRELTDAIEALETIDSPLLGLIVNKEPTRHQRDSRYYESGSASWQPEPVGNTP